MPDKETAENAVTISDSDDLFASQDLLDMNPDEKEEETETETETEIEEAEDENIFSEDTDDTEEEPEEEEPKPKPDKLDNMTPEQLKESYKNLEALYGRQASELGELRKQVNPEPAPDSNKQYTEADIPTMPEADLNRMIKAYETYLATPGKSIDDSDNFGMNTIQYNKLLVEQRFRQHSQSLNSSQTAKDNEAVATRYNAKLALSTDELAQVTKYALEKLSDDGKLTDSDMDVALHKLLPAKFNKMIGDKERERIAKAKTTTPRIPSNANPPTKGTVSVADMKNMDSDELADFIMNDATDEQVEELKRKKII